MHYIKVEGNKVILAGQVATQQMLDEGYVEYAGAIPENGDASFLMWDENSNTIYEDTSSRLQAELAGIRFQRDELLKQSDWVSAKAAETGQPVPEAWQTYRQALRDITEGYTVGKIVKFPAAPTSDILVDADPLLYPNYAADVSHVDTTPPGTPSAYAS